MGIILLGLFCYLNEIASPDNVLHEYRLRLVLVFVVAIIIHGAYLIAEAVKKKRYVWMVLMLIAPVPVYWIYYLYVVVIGIGNYVKAKAAE
ncbi:hypothetical protein F1529_00290 [Alcanivorax sp. VBW004]|uniref:hypothetical protein n=1 Tax=Alcanivorax sp. VBW004 TaxID=1287708 RepID=UPI0012BCE34B|nr:hypothetical protein [Alcanivorax sp. VBW004]MTT50909.1 hypothetical protein [Alcanivorax sp. VBW004]